MTAAGAIFTFLVAAFWQSTLLVIAAWLVLRVRPATNAMTRYAIWFAALTASLVLPMVATYATSKAGGSSRVASVADRLSAKVASASSRHADVQLPRGTIERRVFHTRYTLPAIAGTVVVEVWAAGAAMLLLRLAVSLLHLESLKREALPLAPERRERLSSWNRANRTWRNVRLCVSDRTTVPAAIGLFDAMVLIPTDLEKQMEASDLDRVVLHELAHLRRHDDWTNALAQLFGALLFFSPAVAFAIAQLDFEREVACDDYVLSASPEPLTYANTLSRMTEIVAWPHRRLAAPGIFMTRRGMSMRIERILDDGRDVRSHVSAGAALIAGMTIAAVWLIGAFAPSIALSQTESSSVKLKPVEDASPSAISYSGTWELKYPSRAFQRRNVSGLIYENDDTKGLLLGLHYPAGLSNWTVPADLAALGIDPARLQAAKASIAFVVKRDAGRFECRGQAGNGVGNGEFRFRPNVQYAAELATLGLKLTLRDQVVAAMADISVDYARAIDQLGMTPMSFQKLIGLRMFGGSLEQLQALHRDFPSADAQAMTTIVMMMQKHLSDVHPLHELFPSATIDDVTAMGMAGVTPDFVAQLRSAGVRGLSAGSVTGLRSMGVDKEFVKRMVGAGKTGLTVDDVAALKSSGF